MDRPGGTSLVLDPEGRAHLSYWDNAAASPNRMRYAVRNATGWTIETVGSFNFVNDYEVPSLALDSNGIPHIAAYPGVPPSLLYFSRIGNSWTSQVVESWNMGACCELPSLALDSSDHPRIASYNESGKALRYAYFEPLFGAWVRQNVYTQPNVLGGEGSLTLALDMRDRPRISYLDTDVGQLRYVYFNGVAWNTETPDPATITGWGNSLALDPLEAPNILYTWNDGTDLWVKHAWQVWPDTVPPSSHVLAFDSYWGNRSPVEVRASATDPGGGVANVTLWYRFSADNATWTSWTTFGTLPTSPWTWSFSFPSGEGHYAFYTTSIDGVGNEEPPPPSPDAFVGYDATPPVSTVRPIMPYWHASPSVVINVSASDALSGIAAVDLMYSYALDNASWGPWTAFGVQTAPPWSTTFPFSNGEGHYRFYAKAQDVAGNIEASKTTPEAVAGYYVPPDYAVADASPASPLTVGLSRRVTLSVDLTNLGGSGRSATTLAFYNATTPESPFLTFPVSPLPAGGAAGPFAAEWLSPPVPGTYEVVAEADSSSSLQESNESNNVFTWTLVAVPGPLTSLVVGSPNHTESARYVTSGAPLSFLAIDQGGTGIRNTTYRIDGGPWINYTARGPFTLAGEGAHRVEWSSEDFAGNVEAVANATIVVDDTPPAIAIDVGAPHYVGTDLFVTSSTPFSLSASDGGVAPVGLATLKYRLGGGPWIPYIGEFSVGGTDGPKEVEVRAADLLGNLAADAMAVVLDDTPPVTTPSLQDGTYSPQTTLAFSATDGGSGVARTEVRVDGGAWTTYTAPLHVSEGHHAIGFRSVDNLNTKEAERLLSVTISSEPSSPPPPQPNWKPLVAALFAVLLAIVGAWSADRSPWTTGRRPRLRAFAFTAVPFVAAEAATGVVSLTTGLLSMPPILGAGAALDSSILVAGLAASVIRARGRRRRGPGGDAQSR